MVEKKHKVSITNKFIEKITCRNGGFIGTFGTLGATPPPIFFLLCLINIAASLSPIFSQSANDARVVVIKPILVNMDLTQEYIGGMVQSRVMQNVKTYLPQFSVIDATNESEIKALQAKSENDSYDSATALEIGKLSSANNAIFSRITKIKKGYMLSISFTDLVTGVARAKVTSDVTSDPDSFYSNAGCTIDMLTINMIEQMGYALSASQVYTLKYGARELTNEERIKQAQLDENEYQKSVAQLDNEITKYQNATDPSSIAALNALQAQKIIEEEQLRQAQDRAKRLKEAQDKLKSDKQKDDERSESLKQQRLDISNKLLQKTEALKKAKIQSLDYFSKIQILQSKKRALKDIEQSIKEQEAAIREDSKKAQQEKEEEVMAKQYRKGELTPEGEPTEKALQVRKYAIDKEKAKIQTKCALDIDNLHASVAAQLDNLKSDINNDTMELAKEHTAISGTGDIHLSFGIYDGKNEQWSATAYIYSGGQSLFSCDTKIKYSDLCKVDKTLPTSEGDYDAYLDKVDLLDSLFTREEPILTVKATYTIILREYKNQTRATFSLKGITIIDTLSGKDISKVDRPLRYTFIDSHDDDLRSEKEKEIDDRQEKGLAGNYTAGAKSTRNKGGRAKATRTKTANISKKDRELIATQEERIAVLKNELRDLNDEIKKYEGASDLESVNQRDVLKTRAITTQQQLALEEENLRMIQERIRLLNGASETGAQDSSNSSEMAQSADTTPSVADEEEVIAKEERKQKAKEIRIKDAWAYHTMGGGSRTAFGAGFGFTDGKCDDFAFSGELIFALWSHLYLDITFGARGVNAARGNGLSQRVDWADYSFTNIYALGINERIHWGRFHPNIFGSVGLGYDVTAGAENNGDTKGGDWDTWQTDFVLRLSAGVDIPFNKFFALNFTYSLDYKDAVGFYDVYTFGFFITVPTLKLFSH